jgi:hypothetical protein
MLKEQFVRQILLLPLEVHWGLYTGEEPTAQNGLWTMPQVSHSIFIKLVRGQKRKRILKKTFWFLLVTNQRPFTQKSNIFQSRFCESFHVSLCLWRTSYPVYMSWKQASHTARCQTTYISVICLVFHHTHTSIASPQPIISTVNRQ